MKFEPYVNTNCKIASLLHVYYRLFVWSYPANGMCSNFIHYDDVIMGAIASQITSLAIVYSTVYSDADQRKHQNSASLAFVRGIHRGPENSPHKWAVTRKMFPFDDVIMSSAPVIINVHDGMLVWMCIHKDGNKWLYWKLSLRLLPLQTVTKIRQHDGVSVSVFNMTSYVNDILQFLLVWCVIILC